MIRAPLSNLHEGERALDGEVAHYLVTVRRLGVGDRVRFFDKHTHTEADGTIVHASAAGVRVHVGAAEPARIVAERELILVYALAKGDKVDSVVRDATELGATRVILADTERCVVRLDEKKRASKRSRWAQIAEQAARQSGRADPPSVEGPWPFEEALARTAGVRVLLTPLGAVSLRDALSQAERTMTEAPISVAVGPEGGFSNQEVRRAEAMGFVAASFGSTVLRTETAAVAALAAVRVLLG